MANTTDTQKMQDTWKHFESEAKSAYSDGKGEKVRDENGLSITFCLSDNIGSLADALMLFKERKISLINIESSPSMSEQGNYEFCVQVDESNSSVKDVSLLLEDLRSMARYVSFNHKEVLWFPRKVSELDRLSNRVASDASEIGENHPGYTDESYRARRKEIVELCMKYKYGDPLPQIDYTKEEIDTWNVVFNAVTKLHPTHACKEFNNVYPSCGYKLGTIPQFHEISQFVKDRSGFTLRPVAGLLSARDFLCGLALRVFFATPYIRHSDTAMFSPEPDVAREFLGHVPLLADPEFANFVQELGMISLGAPEEWIERISRIFWFTLEFGMIRENGELKVYGSSLLSSFGELQHCVSDKPSHHPFQPERISETSYPIQEYQPQYFVVDSFKDATNKLKQWATAIPKPQSLRYNAYTGIIESLEDKERIVNLIGELKSDMDRVADALKRVN